MDGFWLESSLSFDCSCLFSQFIQLLKLTIRVLVMSARRSNKTNTHFITIIN